MFHWLILVSCLGYLWSVHAVACDSNCSLSVFRPVVCYYYGWAPTRPRPMNYEIKDIPTELCNEITLAYVGINSETGELKSVIPEYVADDGLYKKLTALKSPYVSVLLSVGGWEHGGQDFSLVVRNDRKRKNFVNSALWWARTYGFDGIDIQWMYPGIPERGGISTDKENYVKLLKELKEEFSNWKLLLTAAFPVSNYYLNPGYSVGELSQYVDWINVLTYDLRGTWKGVTDIQSPLQSRSIDEGDDATLNVKDGLKRLVDLGAPREKLMVGIPFFGRTYKLLNKEQNGLHAPIDRNASPQPGPFVRSNEIKAYYEICPHVSNGSWVRRFDEEGKSPYAFKDDQWVGYDDPESIKYKVNLVLNEKYRGVMVWNNDLDDFRGVCGRKNPLLKTIVEGLEMNQLLDPRDR